MVNHDEWTQVLRNMPKCKNCISYDTNETKEYDGKVAICSNRKSGRYKIGHYSVCCEFYQESTEI